MTHHPTNTPLACDLTAIPDPDQRHQHTLLANHILQSAQERHQLPDGYALRFTADDYSTLAAFVANERHCCPFFHFELDISPQHGPIWLRLRGSNAIRDFLTTQLTSTTP